MNILHVVSAPAAGGAEIYVRDMAVNLARSGHEVHVGFLSHAVDIGRCAEFEREFIELLTNEGVSHFFIGHMARRIPWLGIKRVRDYVVANCIDVYHSHLTFGILFGALLRVPRVYTHHNIKMRVGRLSFQVLNSFVDRLVGISRECSTALEEYSDLKVDTIPNGVDTGRIAREKPFARELDDEIRCIAVGRICAQKNYSLLVQSIADLPPDIRSKIALRIVGDGEEHDVSTLRALISELGLHEIVDLVGLTNNIPELLADSHLFLMSSAYEGLPIAQIEAAISGLPMVVTNVGGCGEIVEDCQNGIVVEPGDSQLFADAIQDIVFDTARFTEFSKNALANSDAYHIESSVSRHLMLYTSLDQARD